MYKTVIKTSAQTITHVCIEDDIRVSAEEATVLLLRPTLHLEFDNPPHLQADLCPGSLPRRFGFSRLFLDALLGIRTEECEVRILPVVLFRLAETPGWWLSHAVKFLLSGRRKELYILTV